MKDLLEPYKIYKPGIKSGKNVTNKISKYMTSISKNLYIFKLDDIVNEYNNTYCKTIKMKLIDLNFSPYFDFGVKRNNKGPKFKVGNHVRISEYKYIFAKCHTSN